MLYSRKTSSESRRDGIEMEVKEAVQLMERFLAGHLLDPKIREAWDTVLAEIAIKEIRKH